MNIVIPKRFVDLFAHNSQVGRDVAERDIILSYALKVLEAGGLLKHLAFKGGTCLRKTLFGTTGRFSMNLDFTALRFGPTGWEARIDELFEGRTHHGISFRVDAVRAEQRRGIVSYGCDLKYEHEWNSDTVKVQISLRERPVLEVIGCEILGDSYWRFMEFAPFSVPCLRTEELLAEKIRAALERTRSRDLFDLFLFAGRPYNRKVTRALAVEKAWNARLVFQPDRLLKKVQQEEYDWDDLETLLPTRRLPSRKAVVRRVIKEYSYLLDLEDELRRISDDARSHRLSDEVERLRRNVRRVMQKATT